MIMQRTYGKGFSHRLYDALLNNTRQVILVVGLILFFIGLAFGYMLWKDEQNKSAQRYFGLLVMEYNQAKQDKSADLSSLLKKFEAGYEKHSGSSLTPYYKDYAVDILLQQNKHNEAVELLDTIISDTQASAQLPLYQLERALVLLDTAEGEQLKKTEDDLRALAYDESNQFHDAALFYLGQYYWSHDNIGAAREVWQKLVDEQANEKIAPSPWAQQVKGYLALVIV